MVNNTGLKSCTFRILHVNGATTPTTTVNVLAGNGLTLITPMNKDVFIRKVECSTISPVNRSVTQPANGGFQANTFLLDFFFVKYNGQPIISQVGFQNLFIPDPAVSVSGQEVVRSFVNQIQPMNEYCILAGGISIRSLWYQLQQTTSAGAQTEFNITIWYHE